MYQFDRGAFGKEIKQNKNMRTRLGVDFKLGAGTRFRPDKTGDITPLLPACFNNIPHVPPMVQRALYRARPRRLRANSENNPLSISQYTAKFINVLRTREALYHGPYINGKLTPFDILRMQ
jgi:hypothetical protein